jgi:hypothetical protein
MGRFEPFNWLPRYRAVLVATAIQAVRAAPLAIKERGRASNCRARAGAPAGTAGWRSVAIAAGAVTSPKR